MAQATQDEYADAGGVVIQMIELGHAASSDQLLSWAERYDMTTVPVVDANEVGTFEMDGYVPTVYFVGPDMTILSADDAYSNLGDFL